MSRKVVMTIRLRKEDIPKERLSWNGLNPGTKTFRSLKDYDRNREKTQTRKEIRNYE